MKYVIILDVDGVITSLQSFINQLSLKLYLKFYIDLPMQQKLMIWDLIERKYVHRLPIFDEISIESIQKLSLNHDCFWLTKIQKCWEQSRNKWFEDNKLNCFPVVYNYMPEMKHHLYKTNTDPSLERTKYEDFIDRIKPSYDNNTIFIMVDDSPENLIPFLQDKSTLPVLVYREENKRYYSDMERSKQWILDGNITCYNWLDVLDFIERTTKSHV
jgi:hypothetical protein